LPGRATLNSFRFTLKQVEDCPPRGTVKTFQCDLLR